MQQISLQFFNTTQFNFNIHLPKWTQKGSQKGHRQ